MLIVKICDRKIVTWIILLALLRQLIYETLELLLTSRDSELFVKAKLRERENKNLFKHAKESKNWQNHRLFEFSRYWITC